MTTTDQLLPPTERAIFMCDASVLRCNPFLGEQLAALGVMLKKLGIAPEYWQDRLGLIETCSIKHELELWQKRVQFNSQDKSHYRNAIINYLEFEYQIQNNMPIRYVKNQTYEELAAYTDQLIKTHIFDHPDFGEWEEKSKLLRQKSTCIPLAKDGLHGSINNALRTSSYFVQAIVDYARQNKEFSRSLTDEDLHYFQLKREQFTDALQTSGITKYWNEFDLKYPRWNIVKGTLSSSPYMLKHVIGKIDPITHQDLRTPIGREFNERFADYGEQSMAMNIINAWENASVTEQAKSPIFAVMDDRNALKLFDENVRPDHPYAHTLTSRELAYMVVQMDALFPEGKKLVDAGVIERAKQLVNNTHYLTSTMDKGH